MKEEYTALRNAILYWQSFRFVLLGASIALMSGMLSLGFKNLEPKDLWVWSSALLLLFLVCAVGLSWYASRGNAANLGHRRKAMWFAWAHLPACSRWSFFFCVFHRPARLTLSVGKVLGRLSPLISRTKHEFLDITRTGFANRLTTEPPAALWPRLIPAARQRSSSGYGQRAAGG